MIAHPRFALWHSFGHEKLVATLVDTAGAVHRLGPVPHHDADRWDWLANLEHSHGLTLEMVVPDSVPPRDPFPRLALTRSMPVWCAPDALVRAIAQTAFARASPATLAAIAARLPASRHWRHLLRCVRNIDDSATAILF